MDFTIQKKHKENIASLMRKIGYYFRETSQQKADLSFVRPLGPYDYPRFHIYLKENKETGEMSFNLHLDQKKPLYGGSQAHNAEYGGKVVEEEADRIKNMLS